MVVVIGISGPPPKLDEEGKGRLKEELMVVWLVGLICGLVIVMAGSFGGSVVAAAIGGGCRFVMVSRVAMMILMVGVSNTLMVLMVFYF